MKIHAAVKEHGTMFSNNLTFTSS